MALYTDIDRGNARHLPRFIATIRARLAEAREIRRIESELSQMSDRELADIGIHRSAIARIARESV